MKKLNILMAMAAGAMAVASCSNGPEGVATDLETYQKQTYIAAFEQEFGKPAADQNWGFGQFEMVEVTKPEGSPDYDWSSNGAAKAKRRVVASSVTGVTPTAYNNRDEFLAADVAAAYFFLRVDNKIVYESSGVVELPKNCYYPDGGKDLGNGVKDIQYNTDNEGSIYVDKFMQLNPGENDKGISFSTEDEPIDESIFAKMPSFEAMTSHMPDAEKAKFVGGMDNLDQFNSDNFQIFWYVCKWQSGDKLVHVDGILVPSDQITVNVPEYKKRIIVEDLKGTLTANSQVSTSDFDFNDVVFDAVTWKIDGKNHLKIIVRAAGGTLPIYVAGHEVHEGIGYMFNTSNPNYGFSKVLIQDSIIGSEASTFDFNSIPVEVIVNGKKSVAGSNIGEAPEKVAVGLDYLWCKERQSIIAEDAYPRFQEYVGNKDLMYWWR